MDVFIKRIKINRFPIDVESVEVNFDDFTGEFDYFEINRGEWGEEIVERLDTAGKLLYKSVNINCCNRRNRDKIHFRKGIV